MSIQKKYFNERRIDPKDTKKTRTMKTMENVCPSEYNYDSRNRNGNAFVESSLLSYPPNMPSMDKYLRTFKNHIHVITINKENDSLQMIANAYGSP